MIVRLRAIGPLAEALGGGRLEIDVGEGCCAGDLLDRLVRDRPPAAPYLGRSGNRPVSMFRASLRLDEGDRLNAGDEVHLVVTVAGG